MPFMMPKPTLPIFESGNDVEQLALYYLVVYHRHQVIPSEIVSKYVLNDLVNIYTWDIGLPGKSIYFAKLTNKGRKGAERALSMFRREQKWAPDVPADIYAEKETLPHTKFLMHHERFRKELRREGIEELSKYYAMEYSVPELDSPS